jgi:hypothetical protein
MNLEKMAKEIGRYAGRAVGDETSGALAGIFVSSCPKREDSDNSTALLPPLSGTATSILERAECFSRMSEITVHPVSGTMICVRSTYIVTVNQTKFLYRC